METQNQLTVINPEPVIVAANAFRESRIKAWDAMVETASKAVDYGSLLHEKRQELGSGKKLQLWLIETIPQLPLEESRGCMKVAARYVIEGDSLFHQRHGAAWAQAELGLLPPPPPKHDKPHAPLKPADALAAIERCKAKLAEVFKDCPFAAWTEAEQTALHKGLAELDLIGGDK